MYLEVVTRVWYGMEILVWNMPEWNGISGEIGPERAGAPPQTSPLPPERELRQFLGQRMLLDRSTESLCDAK